MGARIQPRSTDPAIADPSGAGHAAPPAPGMVWIPGGTFRMGSDRHYPEEAPAHRVTVGPFWIDRTPVSNRQFRKFVNETGHVTLAELPPDAKEYGDLELYLAAQSNGLKLNVPGIRH